MVINAWKDRDTRAAIPPSNANNFKVSGTTTGVPTVQAQQAAGPRQGSGDAQPSIIIVEVLGFGGGDGGEVRPMAPFVSVEVKFKVKFHVAGIKSSAPVS